MRVLGVDHGEKRIGLAISDSTGTIARPLAIVNHVSREEDARHVLEFSAKNDVTVIVVGCSTDEEGFPNAAGRRARRFAEALKEKTETPVELWDESLSTQDARAARIAGGASRKRRRLPVDSLAAVVILQSYLDAPRQAGRRAVEA